MAKIPYHLIKALEELGTQEYRGSENPRIIEYWKHTPIGLPKLTDEIPWCAVFANWVLEESGYNGTGVANARSFLNNGYKIDKPVPGCIVVFSSTRGPAQGHVGFFLSKTGSTLYIIGGNQSDSVCVAGFNERTVLGYRTPTA